MDIEEMICNGCGNSTYYHRSQLCTLCRELKIEQLKDELEILES